MKRLILTGYDDNMRQIGDATTIGKAYYAARFGYQLECVREYQPDTHPSWQKLRLLLERLERYDEIMWLDADSLITNPMFDVMVRCQEFEEPLIVSRDWGLCGPDRAKVHFSMGNFIVRRAAIPMLEEAASRTQWANSWAWEQSAIQEMVSEDSDRWPVKILLRRCFNAVPIDLRPAVEPWQPGDFLAHLTADDNVERAAWIESFCDQISG